MQTSCRLSSVRHDIRNFTAVTAPCHRAERMTVVRCCATNVAPDSSNDTASSTSRRQALSVLGGGMIALTAGAAAPPPAVAGLKDYNLVDPEAPIEEVSVQLGTVDGQLVFTPNTLEFTQGRITKLKLTNPSTQTHYFTALEFATKIYTIMLLAGEPAVEVKGSISEVELKGGASASWIFIPIKPGKYPLRCTKKGHDAMLGSLVIKRAA